MANELPPSVDMRKLTQGAGALGFDPRPVFTGFGSTPDGPVETDATDAPEQEGDDDA